ncbi:DNA/RNA non-specific endonuclease [Methylovulum psychrotolerans]|uniref:DNA/RNA non-specific endonuclease n=1 Tax=Methylovulum psychrotolerans TaxID=1704499 RepID=UPI0011B0DBAA|nr:DNA/RNA non-specific endonuclease [Methylovulum psychrotolerans]
MSEEIGYSGYALRFSGITRTPLWSAEHLTAGRVADACVMNRHDKFHTDPIGGRFPVGAFRLFAFRI